MEKEVSNVNAIEWVNVSRDNPCPVCSKPDWCAISHDQKFILCRREGAGALKEKEDANGGIYWVHAGSNLVQERSQQIKVNPVKKITPVTSIQKTEDYSQLVHNVYSDLILATNDLPEDERNNLLARGFTEEDLVHFGSTSKITNEVLENLYKKYGHRLATVAGFEVIKTDIDGVRITINVPKAQGILIKSVDDNGLIRNLRIRKNNVREGESRFVYFSMSHIAGLPSVKLNCHVAGTEFDKVEAILTEGEMKSFLISKHFKKTSLGLPGVGNAKLGISVIDKLKFKKVILAFDKDHATNKHVLIPLIKTYGELRQKEIEVSLLLWGGDSKGADDAIQKNDSFFCLKGDELKNYLFNLAEKLGVDFEKQVKGFRKSTYELAANDIYETTVENIEANWSEELHESISKMPTFTEVQTENLPPLFADYVFGAARRASFPIEYLANSIFSVTISLTGRILAIRPKRNDNWLVIPTYWTMNIGKPSKKKSPAQTAAVKFIEVLEAELEEENKKRLAEWSAEKQILEQEKQQILKKIKADSKAQNAHEARASVKERLSEIELKLNTGRPALRRLMAVDVTKEKLVEILRDNPRGILLVRDELGGLFAAFFANGREQERSFYLECYNGDGAYTEERKTRESVFLKGPLITIIGSIQPGVISEHILESNNGSKGADGFTARFAGMCNPNKRKFVYVDEPAQIEEFQKILNVLRKLRDFQPIESDFVFRNADGLHYIGFSDEAQILFAEWLTQHEYKLESEVLSDGLEAHLGKYAKSVCSLALMYHLLEWASEEKSPELQSISKSALEFAIEWMKIQETHATHIYNYLSNERKVAATLLLEKIEDGKVEHGCTVRDIYRNEWAGLSKQKVELALNELSSLGILRVVDKPTTDSSATSRIVLVHPKLRNKK